MNEFAAEEIAFKTFELLFTVLGLPPSARLALLIKYDEDELPGNQPFNVMSQLDEHDLQEAVDFITTYKTFAAIEAHEALNKIKGASHG